MKVGVRQLPVEHSWIIDRKHKDRMRVKLNVERHRQFVLFEDQAKIGRHEKCKLYYQAIGVLEHFTGKMQDRDTHQYGVFPWVQLSLFVYDGPLTSVESMELRISGLLTKWFAILRSLSSVGLESTEAKLHLLPTVIVDKFKVASLYSFWWCMRARMPSYERQDGPRLVSKEDGARCRVMQPDKDMGSRQGLSNIIRWCTITEVKKRNLMH